MYSSRRTNQNHMPSFSSISVLPCNDALRCRVSDTFQEVERGRLLDGHVRLGHATQTMDTNPIKTAIMVCSELIRRKVRRILEKESGCMLVWNEVVDGNSLSSMRPSVIVAHSASIPL